MIATLLLATIMVVANGNSFTTPMAMAMAMRTRGTGAGATGSYSCCYARGTPYRYRLSSVAASTDHPDGLSSQLRQVDTILNQVTYNTFTTLTFSNIQTPHNGDTLLCSPDDRLIWKKLC
jgi:hypothetical protein